MSSTPTTPQARQVCTTEDRPAWLLARQPFIGASAAPALLMQPDDLPGYLHPAKVWGYGVFGPTDESANDEAATGLWIEPHLLQRAADLLGATETYRKGVLYASTRWPWLAATSDGWIRLPEADKIPQEYAYLRPWAGQWVWVEIKNTSKYSDWEVSAQSLYQVPERFWIQGQSQMAATGLEVVILIAFVVGRDFHMVPILRDDAFIEEHLVPITKRFHDAIQAKDRSILTMDGHPETEKLLRRLFPKPDPEVPPIEISDDLVNAFQKGKQGEALLAATKTVVLDYMENAGEAHAPSGYVFKRNKAGALSLQAPKKEGNAA